MLYPHLLHVLLTPMARPSQAHLPRSVALHFTRAHRTFEGGVEGFTVAFSAGSLGNQAKRSVRERSDPVWAEAEGAVLKVARRFQQARDQRLQYYASSSWIAHLNTIQAPMNFNIHRPLPARPRQPRPTFPTRVLAWPTKDTTVSRAAFKGNSRGAHTVDANSAPMCPDELSTFSDCPGDYTF